MNEKLINQIQHNEAARIARDAQTIRRNASDAQLVAARFTGSEICDRCNFAFVGGLCPKCSTKAALIAFQRARETGGCGTQYGITNDPKEAEERIAHDSWDGCERATVPPARPKLVLRLEGQVRGGKNAMGVTKSGRHYAKAPFKKWRAEMVAQVNAQDAGGILISTPTNVRIEYVAGDRKRRDQTGIFDALFHLLEYAQVVTDDSLIWVTESTRTYDKKAPGVTITFL